MRIANRSIWRRRGRVTAVCVAVAAGLLLPLESTASAGVVRAGPREETVPTANDEYLAWTQNSKRRPKHHDVYARRFGTGTAKFKVNSKETSAFTGGIDASTNKLVYTQIRRGQADLKMFDLDTKARTGVSGANSPAAEFFPTVSGNRILFTRFANATSTYSIHLYDRTTHNARELWSGRAFAAAGQVNGNWAVWNTCAVASACQVYRYNIANDTILKLPNVQDLDQYAPSVTPAGTVFFARSGAKFTQHSRMIRFPFGGPIEIMFALEKGTGIGSTFAYTDLAGPTTTVYYDRYKAETNQWNIYSAERSGQGGPMIRAAGRRSAGAAVSPTREAVPAKAGAGLPLR
jgi:hypothetical protein